MLAIGALRIDGIALCRTYVLLLLVGELFHFAGA